MGMEELYAEHDRQRKWESRATDWFFIGWILVYVIPLFTPESIFWYLFPVVWLGGVVFLFYLGRAKYDETDEE